MSWVEDEGFTGFELYDLENEDVWVTRDGREIKISDMTDSHLMNAYKLTKDDRLLNEMTLRLFKAKCEVK